MTLQDMITTLEEEGIDNLRLARWTMMASVEYFTDYHDFSPNPRFSEYLEAYIGRMYVLERGTK